VLQYLSRRVLSLIPTLFVVAVVVFTLVHMTPGDPAAAMLGPEATQEQIQKVRNDLGLNEPIPTQFVKWVGRAVTGNLGTSIFLSQPVTAAIAQRVEPTGLLTLLATVIAVGLGVPAGVIAASRHNQLGDRVMMVLALLGLSVPSFWLGLNLILLFGVRMPILPAAGYTSLAEDPLDALRHLILPAFSLGFAQAGLIARMARSAMLDVMRQDYMRTARAKGLAQRLVIYRHGLRNALIPTLTVIGLTISTLAGGAVVTETVFNLPGAGRLLLQSVLRRDYPVIQGAVLCVALLYAVVNLVVDLAYAWIDPRVRYA
jgi:peptide/nickel transport system permease protein